MIKSNNEKILLVLLPFWDPLIPPSGISCLKSFLRDKGYDVKTVDANVVSSLKEVYHNYFKTLKEYVQPDKYGNFYKIGHDVLRNHMLAHLNNSDDKKYEKVVKEIVYKTFYNEVDNHLVSALIDISIHYFSKLESYFLDLLEKEKPSVLGISVYSDTLPASLFAFKLAKEKYPHIKTVMGGGVFATDLTVGSPNFESFLKKTPYIDHIIIGEGEILLLQLLRGKLNPWQRVYSLRHINNEILDINTVDIPDFSDFDLSHYPYLMAYTSRSCPYQCRFCSETIYWGKYRKKTASQVSQEMTRLFHKYGSQLFLMSDSLLNPVLIDLAKELEKSSVPLYWDGYVRADKQIGNPKNTLLFRQAGFYRARLGVESGSQRLLDLMAKKASLEQAKAAISSLAYAGIKTTTYWVIGYPGETEEDFRQTLALLEEKADDIYEADCSPFWYYPTAQANPEQWDSLVRPLYSDTCGDMLMVRTWEVDCQPQREEIYRRMWHFVQHCQRLGIPNPYSLEDIVEADKRWQGLHKNSVPLLLEFNKREGCLDERREIKQLVAAASVQEEEGDFDF